MPALVLVLEYVRAYSLRPSRSFKNYPPSCASVVSVVNGLRSPLKLSSQTLDRDRDAEVVTARLLSGLRSVLRSSRSRLGRRTLSSSSRDGDRLTRIPASRNGRPGGGRLTLRGMLDLFDLALLAAALHFDFLPGFVGGHGVGVGFAAATGALCTCQ